MNDEQNGNSREGLGTFGGDEERTAVIVPRIGRREFALGQRRVADALAGFSAELHGNARGVEERTALGYTQVTQNEAEEMDSALEALEHRVRGVRAVLKRAINPGPTTSP